MKSCPVCSSPFHARVDNLQQGQGRTCSQSCAGTLGAMKRNEMYGVSGKDNPNWRGGVSGSAYRYKQRMMERHPDKVAARKMVYEAIRQEDLERKPCEECGSTENVQAHHEDYDRPLDVTWLCFDCHQELHKSRGEVWV